MKIKKGAIIWPLKYEMRKALIVAGEVYRENGQELYITSGLEGDHSNGSLHPYGYAVDTRTYFWGEETAKRVAFDIKRRLPSPYDVVFESDHIHIEYDVEKGKKELEQMIMEKEFWKSKKFWMAIIGALVPAANAAFGFGLSTEAVVTVVGPIMSYVVGQGIADAGKNKG